MGGEGHPVELARAVLPARDVAAGAQPPAGVNGVLVLAAGPERDTDAGPGLVALVGERQPPELGIEQDGALARAGGDVAVGRERGADADAPALAGPDLGEEPAHVERHPCGGIAGQHALEMVLRQPVLALEEEGAGELEADADEVRAVHQHRAEGGDGLVEQGGPPVLVDTRRLRRADRREAEEEARVAVGPGERAKDAQRVVEPSVLDRRPRLGDAGGGRRGRGRGRRGGQNAGGNRESAEEGRSLHGCGSRPRRPAGKENPRRRDRGAGGGSEDREVRTKPPRLGIYAYLRAPNAPAMLAASLSAWKVPPTPSG